VTGPILQQVPLGVQWPTVDPFLFCVHHDDAYPAANERFGPAATLAGRDLGQDFSRRDGWSMYHGDTVPGFPQHPHRGFETVTLARRGLIDHSDSLGAQARFGHGDVQWLTAGSGIVHAEMFPLLDLDAPNPVELFQIWCNLPAADKRVDPYFTMFWADDIPRLETADAAGRRTAVTVVAGALADLTPPAPPPNSWASRPESDLAIWVLRLEPEAMWTLPRAHGPETVRVLYFFEGATMRVAGTDVDVNTGLVLQADADVEVTAGTHEVECLLLQARPIGEPVAQYGPFVMNTEAEIQAAFADYQRTQFGGWPWPDDGPTHGTDPERFARVPEHEVQGHKS
jgi:quercetin 2,3-dioxygenase